MLKNGTDITGQDDGMCSPEAQGLGDLNKGRQGVIPYDARPESKNKRRATLASHHFSREQLACDDEGEGSLKLGNHAHHNLQAANGHPFLNFSVHASHATESMSLWLG